MIASDIERFKQNVMPVTESGCWLWTGPTYQNTLGYGDARINGVRTSAHRFAYKLYVGQIPEGLCVLHKCDVACCVNPSHLFLGTASDNMRDMFRKNRHPRTGSSMPDERNPNAKLMDNQIREIYVSDKTEEQLALIYGVSRGQISKIRRNDSWSSHITAGLTPGRRPNGNYRLTPAQTDEIRNSTERTSVLAKRYGVSDSRISHIRRKR